MKKDVIISIHGRQELNDPDADIVTLVTAGKFYRLGRHYFINYEESELTGLEGTKTTLKLDGRTLTVSRAGQHPSQLVFEKGRRHISHYTTDFGDLMIAVSTQDITSTLTDDGGSFDVSYSVEIDHALAGMNCLSVTVSPAVNPPEGALSI